MLFTNNLKFTDHIDKIICKANNMLGLVKRTFKHWSQEGFTTVNRI